MLDRSPLRRHPEQPPCDSAAEALCINGIFAVPPRMAHFDLTPHLIFPEHRAIWRSMRRAIDGPPDQFWWRTFLDLRRENGVRAWPLLRVLEWSSQPVVDDSDLGAMVFMLALVRLKRCTAARVELQDLQDRGNYLWRCPDTAFTPEEKVRLLGTEVVTVGMTIP